MKFIVKNTNCYIIPSRARDHKAAEDRNERSLARDHIDSKQPFEAESIDLLGLFDCTRRTRAFK